MDRDLKKLAILGITGGLLMFSQSAAAKDFSTASQGEGLLSATHNGNGGGSCGGPSGCKNSNGKKNNGNNNVNSNDYKNMNQNRNGNDHSCKGKHGCPNGCSGKNGNGKYDSDDQGDDTTYRQAQKRREVFRSH